MAAGHFATIPVPNEDESGDDLRESTGTTAALASTGPPGAAPSAPPMSSHGDAAAAPEAAAEAAHTGLTSDENNAAAGAGSGSPASDLGDSVQRRGPGAR